MGRVIRPGSSADEKHGKYEDENGRIYEDEWLLTKHTLYVCPKCKFSEIHDDPLRKG